MATKPNAPAPRAATRSQNIFLAKFMCPARLCESCYLPHILCAHCCTVNTPPQPQAGTALILADFVRDALLGVPEVRHTGAHRACSERSDAGAAGFGGASVPLAICAPRSRRKTAGETPAPPPAGRKHPIENAFQWRSGLPARRRHKRKKRVHIAKKAINLTHERGTRGRARREFPAYHPALEFPPFLGIDRPTRVLGPFALFGCIPVALVTSAQTRLLFHEPLCVRRHTRLNHLCEPGFLRASHRVGTKTGSHRLGRNAHVELRPPLIGSSIGKREVHLRTVGSLVASEANVAVDA